MSINNECLWNSVFESLRKGRREQTNDNFWPCTIFGQLLPSWITRKCTWSSSAELHGDMHSGQIHPRASSYYTIITMNKSQHKCYKLSTDVKRATLKSRRRQLRYVTLAHSQLWLLIQIWSIDWELAKNRFIKSRSILSSPTSRGGRKSNTIGSSTG